MQKITPFLWFDSNAEEAMNFYLSVFKDSNEVRVNRFGEGGSVIVAEFELFGQRFLALNGGPMHAGFTESISFMVHCDGQAEVDYYWESLTADGGKESMCGWLKDKFGVSWQVVPRQFNELMSTPDPDQAGRVMQAMMQMTKFDIQKLQDAYDGKSG